MTTSVWLNDPTILLRNDKLMEIWPLASMSPEEKVNAITRLVIILTIVGYLLTLNFKIIGISILTLGIVILLYYLHNKNSPLKKEKFSNQLSGVYPLLTNPEVYEMTKNDYTQPTVTNPLMNVTLPEIYYDPERKPAAPAFMPQVEQEINNNVQTFVSKPFDSPHIKKQLFSDLGDALNFNRSMLQYNATANTQVPNDRKAFQDYLYGNMLSAKEGNPIALERNHAGAYNYTMY